MENSVDVHSAAEEVFDYCTDLTREHEWNPKLRRVYVSFDRSRTWESVGRSRRLDARAYGQVTAIAGGARLTMRMELRPRGVPRLVLPLLPRYMHRQQERNLASSKALLEG